MAANLIGQYWELTKPRVVALIVFTALVGMFLAVPGLPPLDALCAAVRDQCVERIDAPGWSACGSSPTSR